LRGTSNRRECRGNECQRYQPFHGVILHPFPQFKTACRSEGSVSMMGARLFLREDRSCAGIT
jgi:hypothetical protein